MQLASNFTVTDEDQRGWGFPFCPPRLREADLSDLLTVIAETGFRHDPETSQVTYGLGRGAHQRLLTGPLGICVPDNACIQKYALSLRADQPEIRAMLCLTPWSEETGNQRWVGIAGELTLGSVSMEPGLIEHLITTADAIEAVVCKFYDQKMRAEHLARPSGHSMPY